MDFESALRDHAKHIATQRPAIKHEEAAKHALVLHLLTKLGYDIHNATEVASEYVADMGMKQGEKVDYAIFDGSDEPIFLIECKKPMGDMGSSSETQLARYFSTKLTTRFGILTNGITYNFYSDIENQNVMDDSPFYETDLTNITENDVKILSLFRRGEFNLRLTIEEAEEMKYSAQIRQIIRGLFDKPDEEFVKWITKKVSNRHFRGEVKQRFTALVVRCLREEIAERSQRDSIPSFTMENEESPVENADLTEGLPKDGLSIVHDIINDLIHASRVTLVHNRNYCSIIVDGKKNSQQVARLHFTDPAKLSISLYNHDAKHWGPKIPLNSLTDIREHRVPIRNIISAILARDAKKQG